MPRKNTKVTVTQSPQDSLFLAGEAAHEQRGQWTEYLREGIPEEPIAVAPMHTVLDEEALTKM
ncbi:hypothetical protein PRIPAC_92815 [Pristionchus pacificus]|uniref:Uncharacterized protein n=1 Tax=Pristionchus pacificus TaxID=54126 RepID=A0A2A6BA09_PRIPA|nr:hypothetical protein PRIPAC_92815 [Pristionchus pacificus]|eukprot:PDM62708.1 hypothetical protein PRIPAC_49923 [Pristionchus pacificus]